MTTYLLSNRAINVLSLFDGMACGMIALQNIGVEVRNYYAYEIDKYAIQTAKCNFPDIQELGDVFEADFTTFKDIDLLMGGSPCTYWSIAQSTDRRETTASGMGWELFSQYVRALREAKPKYFLYENNKSMARAIYESISKTFGFEPIMINSALVSAQNRQRYYWVGIRQQDGTYKKVDIDLPEDREILLRDILVNNGNDLTSNDKSYALTASYDGAVAWNTIERSQRNMVAEPVNVTYDGKAHTLKSQHYKNGVANYVTNGGFAASAVAEPVGVTKDGKSFCQSARYYKGVGTNPGQVLEKHKDSMVAEPVSTVQVGALPRPNGELSKSQGFRIYDVNAKSVTLKGCSGGAGGKTGLYSIPIEFQDIDIRDNSHIAINENAIRGVQNKNNASCAESFYEFTEWNENGYPTKAISYADGKTYTVYTVCDGMITIKDKQYPIKLKDGYYIIRKLTVNECKRLQTVPDWYEFPVSNSQAYKMLGNGWTVEVIMHLLRSIPI